MSSFFGFETDSPHQGSGQNKAFAEEDVAVYTWGDVSYDTLGDALQEAGDDLNDETFGSGPIGSFAVVWSFTVVLRSPSGKDFDFSATFDAARQSTSAAAPTQNASSGDPKGRGKNSIVVFKPHYYSDLYAAPSNAWNSTDPNAALPKFTSQSRTSDQKLQSSGLPVQASSVFSRLDHLASTRTEQRQSIPSSHPIVEHAPIMSDSYTSQPRTMAEIEADMRAAAMQQQLLAQKKELARIQMEQQLLAQQQRLQEEEVVRQEQERLLLEQQARQDPLWAIRQAMMEQKMATQGNMHERRSSGPSETSPVGRNRQPMSTIKPPQMVHGSAPQQQMMLQELLYHQQQQQRQFLEQQLHARQHTEQSETEFNEAQRRIQEAEILEAKHRRRISKIQAMVRQSWSHTYPFSHPLP